MANLTNSTHTNINNLQIHPHDIQLHQDIPLRKNGKIKPVVVSLVIHVGLLGLIVLGNLFPNIKQQPVIETALINADDLATIKSQIRDNRNQAAFSNTNDPNAVSVAANAGGASSAQHQAVKVKQATSANNKQPNHQPKTKTASSAQTKPQPSKAAIARNKEIAERNKQFDQALQSFSTEQQRKRDRIRAEKAKAEQKRRQEEREIVEVFKNIEKDAPNKEAKNRQELERVAEIQNKIRQQLAQDKTKTTQNNLAKDGTATGANTNPNVNSNANAMNNIPSGVSGNATASRGNVITQTNNLTAAGAKITRYLYPPLGSGNDITRLRITVNQNGGVVRVVASGNNPDLNKAAEQAARAASPLPITAGDRNYPTFPVTFRGRGTK